MIRIADLRNHARDLSRLEADVLLCHVLNCARSHLFAHPEDPVDPAQQEQFQAMLERRLAGEPLAYLMQCREFWSLQLKVSPDTLIPRADTEILVEQALALPLGKQARVLDLGTGSGAIALALASERPDWQILGIDQSQPALAVARQNAHDLGLGERVAFYQSNWFEALEGQRFDLLIANPPYVAENDPHLTRGDLPYEPRCALTAGPDGLRDLQHLILHGKAHLVSGGYLLMEHGWNQGVAVRDLLHEAGYQAVTGGRDLGGQDRFAQARAWL